MLTTEVEDSIRRRSVAAANGVRRNSDGSVKSRQNSPQPLPVGLPAPNLHSKILLACAVQAFFLALLLAYTEPHKYVLEYIDEHYDEWDFPLIDLDIPFIDIFTTTADSPKVDLAANDGLLAARRLFSTHELSTFAGVGKHHRKVYLAILGKVYDVSKGAKHYGPNGGYGFFAGKDASRAYVTGDFSAKGLTDDVEGLTHQDYLSLQQWMAFYDKDYEHIGYLVGTFYDAKGGSTAQLGKVRAWVKEAEEWKESQEDEQERFPPCNSEWSQKAGGKVWCTNRSGGVRRDWSGLPRRLFTPGSKSWRCACIKAEGAAQDVQLGERTDGDLSHPHLKLYDGCDKSANTCAIPD